MSSLMMTGILLGGAGALAVVLRRRIEEWIAFAALMAGVLLAGFAMADALTRGWPRWPSPWALPCGSASTGRCS